MQGWFADRTPRERYLLLGALVLAGVWLAFVLVWQPLAAREAALTSQIARYERSLAILDSAPEDTEAAPTDSRPVPVILTETAADFSLTIRRLEPEGGGARLVLDEVPFNDVILWLDRLDRDHGLRPTELDMTRRPAPGMVTATLALQR